MNNPRATAAPSAFDIIVIGGGFSGAAVAWNLLALVPDGARIAVVDPAPALGAGLAYSSVDDSHLLNVPAGRLGLDPDDESGFFAWLAEHRPAHRPAVGAGDFVPRHLMGRYVADALAQRARAAAARRVSLVHRRERATALETGGPLAVVRTSGGEALEAGQVVLATGHLPSEAPRSGGDVAWDDPGMVLDPWRYPATAAPDPSAEVLLLGCGLTAVDLFNQLRDAGHRGRIRMLSRRGLLPQPHRANEARPIVAPSPMERLAGAGSLLALLRHVRGWIAHEEASDRDWRDVMASLRSATPSLWQGLAPARQRQFLRHLLPFWDTHRHRFAPAIAARLQAEFDAGSLVVSAGRVTSIARAADGALAVEWRPRGRGAVESCRVARVVNCIGPSSQVARVRDPLLASLVAQGLLTPDPLGLGILVDGQLRPLDAGGAAVRGVRYVGPWLKAQRWEAVAVPELRKHAREAARAVAAALGQGADA